MVTTDTSIDPKGFERHDHAACVRDGIAVVEARCEAEGWKLTPIRKRVLEILLEKHSAVGAYDILDVLRSEGARAQPPVAYRALDFLVKHGFAHKVERLNAFIACAHPGMNHAPAFLICRVCENVAETHLDMAEGDLVAASKNAGFVVERAVIEVEGVCPNCTGG